jgi:hypothetical protein
MDELRLKVTELSLKVAELWFETDEQRLKKEYVHSSQLLLKLIC